MTGNMNNVPRPVQFSLVPLTRNKQSGTEKPNAQQQGNQDKDTSRGLLQAHCKHCQKWREHHSVEQRRTPTPARRKEWEEIEELHGEAHEREHLPHALQTRGKDGAREDHGVERYTPSRRLTCPPPLPNEMSFLRDASVIVVDCQVDNKHEKRH
eukprot:CAMPEP_0194526394 /NCGR_PEP_ID=MMETSP0253-20130528/62181_1 /TAXON_ID=2966 /ORGANISM="Noctiluca scintillans" /LENGTH=153 /DNA_ID=CAMNT_0039371219 /DNA_START=373 /DNA_END=834 /DNA_ORIENTATION=+